MSKYTFTYGGGGGVIAELYKAMKLWDMMNEKQKFSGLH